MSVVLFDTHAFIKRLTAAGMPESQAEVLADEHARLIDERLVTKSDIEPLSTKTDVRELELRLGAQIEAAKAESRTNVESARADILKWMFGTIGFQTLVLLGAIVALAKALR